MGILYKFRKRKKSVEQEYLVDLENLLKKHLYRMENEMKKSWGSSVISTMKNYWGKLQLPEILDFTKDTILYYLLAIKENKMHYYRGKYFPNNQIYVAISVIPASTHSEARSYFKRGYFDFMNTLFDESGYPLGNRDLAHWTYYTDFKVEYIHLTFLPALHSLKQNPNVRSMNALDLFTEEEKRRVGLLV